MVTWGACPPCPVYFFSIHIYYSHFLHIQLFFIITLKFFLLKEKYLGLPNSWGILFIHELGTSIFAMKQDLLKVYITWITYNKENWLLLCHLNLICASRNAIFSAYQLMPWCVRAFMNLMNCNVEMLGGLTSMLRAIEYFL